ncbi:hypothetical protein F443_23040 [Phytophthora nicotianae P1569]|uniref:Uncharacterized protein n=2 Tax=Phytophthora nicotianae TaxID=4792 RepID=V9DU29_PHYNI|nr:hypothetical protein F443_23040 [Phytophthora nicotianae P1569]ETO58631.1 hypothetical protein F444_22988 [Phytophthora nicotianae P1976]
MVFQCNARQEHEENVRGRHVHQPIPDPRFLRLNLEGRQRVLAHGHVVVGTVVDAVVHACIEAIIGVLVNSKCAKTPSHRVDPVDPDEVVRDLFFRDDKASEQNEEKDRNHRHRVGHVQIGRSTR